MYYPNHLNILGQTAHLLCSAPVVKDTKIGCIRMWKSIIFKITIDTVNEQGGNPCKTYWCSNNKRNRKDIDMFMTWESYHNRKKSIQSAVSRCHKSPFYLAKRCLLRAKDRKCITIKVLKKTVISYIHSVRNLECLTSYYVKVF